MPKRIKQLKRSTDINQLAHHPIDVSIIENNGTLPPTKAQVSMFMAEMGRRGGKIGGKRRLETMTAEERSAIAKRAARARWKGK